MSALLSFADLARNNISRSTAYRLIARGEIQAVKVGSRTLIPRESFEKFLASRPVAAIRPPASSCRPASAYLRRDMRPTVRP